LERLPWPLGWLPVRVYDEYLKRLKQSEPCDTHGERIDCFERLRHRRVLAENGRLLVTWAPAWIAVRLDQPVRRTHERILSRARLGIGYFTVFKKYDRCTFYTP
jgi:hypothetical protein